MISPVSHPRPAAPSAAKASTADLTSAWNTQVDRWIDAAPVVDKDSVFVVSYLHRAYAFDASNGSKQWEIDIGQHLTQPAQVGRDNTLVLTSTPNSGDGVVAYGVDRHNGARLWEHPLSMSSFEAGPWVDQSGACFAKNGDGKSSPCNLVHLDARAGTPAWTYPIADNSRFWFAGFGQETIYGAIVGKDPGISDTRMVAIDTRNGQQRWSLPIGRSGDWTVQPTDDGHALVTSLMIPGGNKAAQLLLQKVNAQDGATAWKIERDNPTTRALVGKKGRIFVGEFTRNFVQQTRLVCLDEKSGAPLWTTDTDGHSVESMREGADGTVYAMTTKYAQQGGGRSTVLRALDGASGQLKWQRALSGTDMHDLHLGTNGELLDLYVAFNGYGESGAAELTRLDAADGKTLWRDKWEQPVMSVVKAPTGTLYLDLGTRLAAVDPIDGKQVAEYSKGAWVHVNTQLQSRGQLFVTDHDGRITALNATMLPARGDSQPSPDGIPGGWHMLGTDRHGSAPIVEAKAGAASLLAVDADNCGHYNAAHDLRIIHGPAEAAPRDIDRQTLAALDENRDGLVQGAELAKAGLSLWLDKNGNGVIDPGEPVGPLGSDATTQTLIDLDTMRVEQAITVHDDTAPQPRPLLPIVS